MPPPLPALDVFLCEQRGPPGRPPQPALLTFPSPPSLFTLHHHHHHHHHPHPHPYPSTSHLCDQLGPWRSPQPVLLGLVQAQLECVAHCVRVLGWPDGEGAPAGSTRPTRICICTCLDAHAHMHLAGSTRPTSTPHQGVGCPRTRQSTKLVPASRRTSEAESPRAVLAFTSKVWRSSCHV